VFSNRGPQSRRNRGLRGRFTNLPNCFFHQLIASLSQTEWLQSILRRIAAEAKEMNPGGEAMITRLADILVIQTIRHWLASAPQTGWLGALRDRQIGPVISTIHRWPTRSWNLGSLAAEASMSRSAFAARFSEIVGEPAMRYVTLHQMRTAQTWLAERDMTVAEVAHAFGYESEAAFNRAFKRHTGVTPGTVKRAQAKS